VSFSEQVSRLIKSSNGDKVKFTTEKVLTNEVTVNFNMFGSLMENIIVGNLYGTAIVTIQISWRRL
jgi:hypothetical protein